MTFNKQFFFAVMFVLCGLAGEIMLRREIAIAADTNGTGTLGPAATPESTRRAEMQRLGAIAAEARTASAPAAAASGAAASSILAAGQRPANAVEGTQFQRRSRDGNIENCTVRRARGDGRRGNPRAVLPLIDDCRPVVGSREIARDCTILDTELGPANACRPRATVVNPNAPFEACKYVELAEEDSKLADEIRLREQIVYGCSLIGNPLPEASYISQILNRITLGGSSTRNPLAAGSQVGNVDTVLGFAVQGGEETLNYLDIAAADYEKKHACFRTYQQARWRVQDANRLDQESMVDQPQYAERLKAETGEECFNVVQAAQASYREALPRLRASMLLATGCCSTGPRSITSDWPIPRDPEGVINYNFRRPAGTLTPENPVIRRVDQGDFTYSPATAEEKEAATETFNQWAREIEAEWDRTHPRNALSLERENGAIVQRQKYRADQTIPDPVTRRPVNGTNLQASWESFYRARIAEKRKEALKAVQREFVQNPVFQNLANNTPTAGGWVEAYNQLLIRNRSAQDQISRNTVAGRAELEAYRTALRAHQEGKGPAPSQPSLDRVRDIATAKGALEALVQENPRLCSAAIAYWNAASRMQTRDTVVEMGALVGVSLATGVVGGAAFGGTSAVARFAPAAVGSIGGAGLGYYQFDEARARSTLGYNLLSACARIGEENCRTPGDIERYLEDRFETNIARFTIVIPTPGDGAWIAAVGAGLASARGGQVAARLLPRWLENGRINYTMLHGIRDNLMEGFRGRDFDELRSSVLRSIFGERTPSAAEKVRANSILEALYSENSGMLVKTNPADRAAYQRDFQVLTNFIGRHTPLEAGSFASTENLARALRALQNAETGIAVPPEHLNEVLETIYARLAAGQSPEEAVATVKRFVGWIAEAGNAEHLKGLQSVDLRAQALLQAELVRDTNGRFAQMPPYRQREAIRKIEADAARMQRLNEQALDEHLLARYKEEGLSEQAARERLARERGPLLDCAGGGRVPAGA